MAFAYAVFIGGILSERAVGYGDFLRFFSSTAKMVLGRMGGLILEEDRMEGGKRLMEKGASEDGGWVFELLMPIFLDYRHCLCPCRGRDSTGWVCPAVYWQSEGGAK